MPPLGSTSGIGLASPKTIASLAMFAMSCSSSRLGAETPMKTSAPTSTSLREPLRFSALVFSTSHRRMSEDPSGASYTAPLLSQPMIMVAPCRFSSRMIAEPAAPTPEITNRTSEMSLFTTRSALINAASTTMAVPC